MSVKLDPGHPTAQHPRASTALTALGLLALAVLQVIWCGYSLGVGNQTIQVPLLRKAADPALFSKDLMVSATMADYPTVFFKALADGVGRGDLTTIYFLLHVATAWGVLAGVYALGRAIGGDRLSGVLSVLVVLAGHHRALAGDELYSAGFTHTWAVFPLAIAALVLFYRGWEIGAFAVAGFMFNLHALTAGYLAAMMGFWALAEIRRVGIARLILMALLFALCAAPMAWTMLRQAHVFDHGWIVLTNIRSSAHSLPTTWWAAGNPDIPRFVLIFAMGVMGLSFAHGYIRRKTALLLIGAMLLLGIGFAFAEWRPVPAVMRAQLFRSSRPVMVLLLVQAACAAAWAIRKTLVERYDRGHPTWKAWLELFAWALPFAGLAIAPAMAGLPWAMVTCAIIGLATARLGIVQSSIVALAVLATALAHKTIQFQVPGLGGESSPVGHAWWGDVLLIVIGGILLAMVRVPWPTWVRRCAIAGMILVCFAMIRWAAARSASPPAGDPWVDVQRWAAAHTEPDALFLTPIRPGGFRLHSSRSVVAEWRDGTQAYFSPAFGVAWWRRMKDLQPGIEYDAPGRKMLAPGKPLDALEDGELVRLCEKYGATHIVLPTGRARSLWRVYDNDKWGVYLPQWPPGREPMAVIRRAIQDELDDQWLQIQRVVLSWFYGPYSPRFQEWQLEHVVRRNIERYRKSDISLEVVDPAGRRIEGVNYTVTQTRQAFNFSASLPFFDKPAAASAMGDYHPPPAMPAELSRFLEIFNCSLIPFSGKWMYIEPVEGQRNYAELDKYVNWAAKNNINLEFHFLAGYSARWMRTKTPQQQAELFKRHALDLVKRYGDRIKYWQVVNEAILLEHSPAVFAEIRKAAPDLKLGIADCSKFWTDNRRGFALRDRNRGLDKLQWLKSQGVQVDFFGFHGHRPFGLWASVQDMYDALDAFAAEGVKIHITEFTCPLDVPILGGVQRGTMTPEMQAQWYALAWEVCFSHPAVELINLWGMGPNTWQPGGGLLNDQYQPRPTFAAMKDLIQRRLRTSFTDTLPERDPASFRAFFGDYELSIALPGGRIARAQFKSEPEGPTCLRLKLDSRAATLTPVE